MLGIPAKEIMSAPARTLYDVDTIGNVMALLRETRHNGFVVVSRGSGTCKGMILRNQLIVLKHRRFGGTPSDPVSRDLLDLAAFAPNLQSKVKELSEIEDIVALVDSESAVDMRSYMNPASITVSENCPISRCYMLFRGMGIRHLPVVSDESAKVVGIISRKLLMTDFQQDLY